MYVTTTVLANDDTRSGGKRCVGKLEKHSPAAVQAENTSAGQEFMESDTGTAVMMEDGMVG